VKEYDITILGGGPGGYVAAIKAAQAGKSVALIEKEAIGGVCLNWGCIPTKALLKSAKVYENFKNAKSYGFKVDMDNVEIDFKKIMQRKNKAVKKLTSGVGYLLKKNKVDVYEGEGVAKDAHTVEVNDQTLKTAKLIIATGASPVVPPIDGLKEGLEKGYVLTSKGLLDIDKIPEKLAIVGGGVIGVEFAAIFNALGSKVTILEREDDILFEVDQDIKDQFKKKLKKDKIKVLTGATLKSVGESSLTYEEDGEDKTLDADRVLLSVGMKPNTKGLEALDLEMENGGIKTDNLLRTNIDDVYAIGDCNGKYLLAHVASKEGLVAVTDILGEKQQPMNYDHMPSGIYTFPEIAQVGLTEEKAKARGIDYKTSTFPITANGKALAEGQNIGMVKMIASKPYNEIIGVHILAEGATELISESVLGMALEATAADFAHAVHPHPTLSEMVHETAHGILDKPIHL